jgi:hypothetical protein
VTEGGRKVKRRIASGLAFGAVLVAGLALREPVLAMGKAEAQAVLARIATAQVDATTAGREALRVREELGAGQLAEEAVSQYFSPNAEAAGRVMLAEIAAAADADRALALAAQRLDGSRSETDQLACRLAAVALAGQVQLAADGSLPGAVRPVAPVMASGRGRVAFWKRSDGRWDLCISGPRLEEPRLVYRSPAAPAEVCAGRVMEWSPDGETLLFCAPSARPGNATHLFLARQDGSGLRCLTPLSRCEADPCWSPDGRRIAFLQAGAAGAARDWSIWIMRADGSGRQQVAAAAEAAIPVAAQGRALLRWSPDGTRLNWRAQPLWVELAAGR